MGFDVVGFDVEMLPYPGQLVLQDVRTLYGSQFRQARVIVASPPCEEFSRHDQPWTKRRNPPPPDLSIVQACFRIAAEAGVPLVLENVRGAQKWIGRATMRYGSRYFWGDGLPALFPTPGSDYQMKKWTKQGLSSDRKRERALIPYPVALWVAQCYAT